MSHRRDSRGFKLVNITAAAGGGGGGGGGGLLEEGADTFESPASASSTTRGTQLTGGAANVRGSYVELDASTAFDVLGIIVSAQRFSGSNQRHLIEIATGEAASEVVIVPDLYYSTASSAAAGRNNPVFLPISIPSGTRLSARTQSEDASATVDLSVVLVGSTVSSATPSTSLRAYGPDPSVTGLDFIDFGSATSETVNVKSGWVELTAATDVDHESVALSLGGFNGTSASRSFLLDIGIGDAGSETVLIPDILLNTDHVQDRQTAYVGPLPVTIAAGTRLSFRAQCDNVGAGFNSIEMAIYGL